MHRKIKWIIVLSLIGALLPFVGVSIVFRIWFASLLSLTVLVLAYRLHRHEDTATAPAVSSHGGEPLYVEAKPKNAGAATAGDGEHGA